MNSQCVRDGSIEQNGCGKMADITNDVLRSLVQLGVTHVWYTGVIRHATQTDYSRHNIPRNNPHVVKGKAGSPYAIVDYYDVDPDLAIDVERRQDEFDELVMRTHQAGLKVILDFVPNHVAREYHSIAKPNGVSDLGEDVFCSRQQLLLSHWPIIRSYYGLRRLLRVSRPCHGQ